MAAAWALAEATGRGAELSNVRPKDLDLDSGRVWLHGGKRTVDRWGELSEWGIRVLRGRLAEMGTKGTVAYAGDGKGIAGQVSTCHALSTILLRAGLAGQADVRPGSVAAWAGRSRFDAGAGIAEVARMLGVRSLDLAAQAIGWDWTA
jgi:integrase/recombinase XerC